MAQMLSRQVDIRQKKPIFMNKKGTYNVCNVYVSHTVRAFRTSANHLSNDCTRA